MHVLGRIRQIDPLIAYMVAATLFIIGASFAANAASPNTRGPIVKNPVPAAVAKPAKGWTGIRVGAFGGWAAQLNEASEGGESLSWAANGFLLGGLIGYDQQIGKSVVWRVSTDYSWVHGADQLHSQGSSLDVKRMWSVMTGPGLLVTDKALVYAGFGYTTVYSDVFMAQGLSGRTGGLTLGGGIEVMADTGFSFNLEYRWTDIGNDTVQWGGDPPLHLERDLHQVRAGVNFKFDSPLK
jgi:opacity protein-like surface antigen